ncbi:VWA domain-containing protein [Lutimonas zeaxanthinifaciens]|uniref:VWA domain-containing protein n=1 Tax=Lutimonas zeaxanthinifaciens TaxID=3060215 RepID=UPI00265D31FE|nr:VWA domain-containing protein [Lutimonas sp. YSD2104]WKK66653.1 VWA domain-containing protein [Lutimonas sp. YSD2104]
MNEGFLHMNWEEFHFLRPQLLWLLPAVFLSFILAMSGLRETIKWKEVIAPHLRPFMIKKGSENIKKWMHVGLFITLSLAILGVAGPTWQKVEEPDKILETPMVILLDLSQSMMVTDIQPSRLERSKFKIRDLLDSKPGARIALIGYAGTAHTIVPLTRDYKIINSHIKTLSPDIMPFPGSDLQNALELADTITSVSNAPGHVLLISDDFTEESFNMIQKFINANNHSLTILPMNTIGGAAVPANRGSRALKDKQGKEVFSSLNKEILNKIGSLERVTISPLTLDKSDMEFLANKISDHLEFKEDPEEKEDNWKDEGPWLAIPFAVIILAWFRKGWVLYGLLIMFSLGSCSEESKFMDLWKTRDFQAQQEYDKKEFSKAAELYQDPLREGVAWYKSGDYKKAIEAFQKDTTAMGAYNLGLAYYENGDYAEAASAFDQAVQLDPDLEGARKNKELTQQIMEGESPVNPEEAQEVQEDLNAENIENKDMEDLGGGGQEASEEDMKQERKEETVGTDMRTGKEMDEVPPDFESGKSKNSQKVLMRKVDDDPSLFLKRKFNHQVKTQNMQPKKKEITW